MTVDNGDRTQNLFGWESNTITTHNHNPTAHKHTHKHTHNNYKSKGCPNTSRSPVAPPRPPPARLVVNTPPVPPARGRETLRAPNKHEHAPVVRHRGVFSSPVNGVRTSIGAAPGMLVNTAGGPPICNRKAERGPSGRADLYHHTE